MTYTYDKDFIKQDLSIEQVEELLAELGGEPEFRNGTLVSRTICHNHRGEGSKKMYYYPNTNLCHCYTGCDEPSFDIFELVRKVLSREQPKQREDSNWNLPEAIDYVARKFGYAPNEQTFDEQISIRADLQLLEKYDRINNIDNTTQEVELKEYDGTFLKYLPHPVITPWEEEGISRAVMQHAGICYDPKNLGIVIPHYDINNRLIGVRERTIVKENEDTFGKYRPAYIGRQMYNHPLSFNLYNLNHSKNNIWRMGTVFAFEGEKSTLLYRSYFGEENDLSVAVCGSSFINYQAWLLINQGAKEIVICFDKQFKDKGDDEFKKLTRNLSQIHNKYGRFVNISIIFDKGGLLGYKESPVDRGKDIFLELYKNRINLY